MLSTQPSSNRPKLKGRAMDFEEPGQKKKSTQIQKTTSQNINDEIDNDDLSSLPDDEGIPPPKTSKPALPKKAAGKKSTWKSLDKDRPSNFKDD